MRILHLEDNANDAELVAAELAGSAIHASIRLVDTAADFQASLETERFDIILADFTLPNFDGLYALSIARQKAPDTPYIFVTGTVGDEAAVSAMKLGATDYVLKTRLDRLPIAIHRAMEAVEEHRKRVTAEKELAESERRYRLLTENIPDILWSLDERANIAYVSPNSERICGFPSKELLQQTIENLLKRVHPEDFERARHAHNELIAGSGAYDTEFRFQHRDGQWIWMRGRATATFRNGALLYAHGIFSDITRHKQLEEEFRRAQKLEAIGRLAGGVAHDFNNILTVIIGYGDLLVTRCEETGVCKEAKEILKAAERAAALTRQLLAFSRKEVVRPQPLNLNQIVAGMSSMLKRLIGEDVELIVKSAPDLHTVMCDPGHMEQVVMNLAVNARDAMPKGGKLIIETKNIMLEASEAEEMGQKPGRYVALSVCDTGMGMDEATKARIFEPFFTTKGVGKGTGLGLSTVYGIVEQSGGYIHVESAPGKGATFTVYCPAAAAEPVNASKRKNTALYRGVETILLVEDEDAVRALSTSVLSGLGYVVIDAADGARALEIFKKQSGRIDIIVTDTVMPLMGAKELIERARAIRPAVKVLQMSGYTDDAAARRELERQNVPFLQKPFTSASLSRAVREALDGSSVTPTA